MRYQGREAQVHPAGAITGPGGNRVTEAPEELAFADVEAPTQRRSRQMHPAGRTMPSKRRPRKESK